MKYLFLTLVLVSSVNINIYATDQWRNVIQNNLKKHFNFNVNNDKLFGSNKVYLGSGGNCETGNIEIISISQDNGKISLCLNFDLKLVKDVLLLSAGCKHDLSFVARYKFDPIKNITRVGVRTKTFCQRTMLHYFVFVRTADDKIYTASKLYLSNYGTNRTNCIFTG